MAKLDAKTAKIVADLLGVIAEEYDDTPNHILIDYYEVTYRAVYAAVMHLLENGYAPPLEALGLIGRFHSDPDQE
jgi:hypothetical protein